MPSRFPEVHCAILYTSQQAVDAATGLAILPVLSHYTGSSTLRHFCHQLVNTNVIPLLTSGLTDGHVRA
ncbi:hypothetical protein EGR_10436 [Echinococcus granulosus]|uniref:Uncharacterized protein n=1 Tax=Echinococcus granulosus TaxID=6210 RepID=W6U2C0_ECHGR|nr:hypothetical protein EGR_10436 [Echinococcus granulosus]EUB54696.1 hypothetical protein EGR_10436 [Echinococcus granulosus]